MRKLPPPLLALCLLIPVGRQLQSAPPKADFFVAPSGNDSWSGKLAEPNRAHTDGPFASPAKAQMAVRDLIQANRRPITVMLRAGTYYLPLSPTNPGTLRFDASDSGTASAPIQWTNYPNE